MISKQSERKRGNQMAKKDSDRIIVEHVYKNFDVYYDKANSVKEKLLFWKRNRKETRQVLKEINVTIATNQKNLIRLKKRNKRNKNQPMSTIELNSPD